MGDATGPVRRTLGETAAYREGFRAGARMVLDEYAKAERVADQFLKAVDALDRFDPAVPR